MWTRTQFCYRHKNGEECSVVATCAHYGICNIMEYAKKLTGVKKVNTYLGGFHLRSDEVLQPQMDKTCEYVKKEQIKRFYICHDSDLPCVIQLANACPTMEAGVVVYIFVLHNDTPSVVIILHRGPFCLLSSFTGSVHGSPAFSFIQYKKPCLERLKSYIKRNSLKCFAVGLYNFHGCLSALKARYLFQERQPSRRIAD